jgi:hypothetical protein
MTSLGPEAVSPLLRAKRDKLPSESYSPAFHFSLASDFDSTASIED